MNKSESIVELAKALNSFQGKLKAVKKDATNPFFKSHYATLDAIWETIREPLSSNGLVVTQTLDQVEGKALLVTTLLHTSGEWIEGSMILNPVKDDPQGLGSAISYARRYSLCALLGVVADEDDDASVATKPKFQKPSKEEAAVIRKKITAALEKIDNAANPDIDMEWLKASLEGWQDVVSWMRKQYMITGGAGVKGVLGLMTPLQVEHFIKEVKNRKE